MHDVALAKQIFEKILEIAKEKEIGKIKAVKLEIGDAIPIHTHTHGDLTGHPDEINPENIKFVLEKLSQKNGLYKVIFDVKKIPGRIWKITEIESF